MTITCVLLSLPDMSLMAVCLKNSSVIFHSSPLDQPSLTQGRMTRPPNAVKEPVSAADTSAETNAAADGGERLLQAAALCFGVIQIVWLCCLQRGFYSITEG